MSDAERFWVVMTAHGAKPAGPGRKLLAVFRDNRVSAAAVAFASAYLPEKMCGVNAIRFYGQADVAGVNAADGIPVCLRDGLLIVGTCPNGDPVAVDVRDRLGEAGYVGHETMWQAADVRDRFVVLTASPGELVEGLRDGRLPLDYYEAVGRHG